MVDRTASAVSTHVDEAAPDPAVGAHDDAACNHGSCDLAEGRVILRTERLVLRPFHEDDVDAFMVFAPDDEYRRHLDAEHPQPAQFVANNVGVEGAWVIELGDQVVGSVFLGEELACLLDPAVHRRGIATEAAAAVVTDGFDRRGYARIIARANSANAASLRAMAKLGFVAAGDGTYTLDRVDWASGRRPG